MQLKNKQQQQKQFNRTKERFFRQNFREVWMTCSLEYVSYHTTDLYQILLVFYHVRVTHSCFHIQIQPHTFIHTCKNCDCPKNNIKDKLTPLEEADKTQWISTSWHILCLFPGLSFSSVSIQRKCYDGKFHNWPTTYIPTWIQEPISANQTGNLIWNFLAISSHKNNNNKILW